MPRWFLSLQWCQIWIGFGLDLDQISDKQKSSTAPVQEVTLWRIENRLWALAVEANAHGACNPRQTDSSVRSCPPRRTDHFWPLQARPRSNSRSQEAGVGDGSQSRRGVTMRKRRLRLLVRYLFPTLEYLRRTPRGAKSWGSQLENKGKPLQPVFSGKFASEQKV